MKIALIGDYSALHYYLKLGLEALGHQVLLASEGDAWKNIPRDYSYGSEKRSKIDLIWQRLRISHHLFGLEGYDVVQIINPIFLYLNFVDRYLIAQSLKKKNGKVFYLGSGDDAFFWQVARQKLKYGPFDDFLKYDRKSESYYMQSRGCLRFNEKILEYCDGIIPIMYEYFLSYENHPKLMAPIPIPIDLNAVSFTANEVRDKVYVYHGINRYGFKGTRVVEQARELFYKGHYTNCQFDICGNLPFVEYQKKLQATNVIIDQVYSHSSGVNGLLSLAMGKVVLGGAEPVALKYLGLDSSPIINITPDPASIVHALEGLCSDTKKISELGLQGREFIEKNHCSKKIAGRYLEAWSST